MEEYSPKLVVGVAHTNKAVKPLLQYLDDKVKNKTIVGTEADSYPLDYIEYHWKIVSNKEFVDFYNCLGDFVTSKGGLYVPLQELSDFKNCYRYLDDDFRERVNRYEERFRKALLKGGVNAQPSIDQWDYVFNEDAISVESGISRIPKRMHLLEGIDPDEDRDNKLVEKVSEYKPEIIVTGWLHVPALMVKYPKIEIKIIK